MPARDGMVPERDAKAGVARDVEFGETSLFSCMWHVRFGHQHEPERLKGRTGDLYGG